MGLNVKSSRCASISMIIFGCLALLAASAFITFAISGLGGYRYLYSLKYRPNRFDSFEYFILFISWYLGYPALLAILTMITGCVGVCASSYRLRRNTCQVVTLFIFSMIIAGLSGYTIRYFSLMFSLTSSPNMVFILINGAMLGLAVLIQLLSWWTMICCLASFCCDNEVAPEMELVRQQPAFIGQQGAMMQGPVMVPMMRTNTVPAMQCVIPSMMQTGPSMMQTGPSMMQTGPKPCRCGAGVSELQFQTQAMPMQVVASPAVV